MKNCNDLLPIGTELLYCNVVFGKIVRHFQGTIVQMEYEDRTMTIDGRVETWDYAEWSYKLPPKSINFISLYDRLKED